MVSRRIKSKVRAYLLKIDLHFFKSSPPTILRLKRNQGMIWLVRGMVCASQTPKVDVFFIFKIFVALMMVCEFVVSTQDLSNQTCC